MVHVLLPCVIVSDICMICVICGLAWRSINSRLIVLEVFTLQLFRCSYQGSFKNSRHHICHLFDNGSTMTKKKTLFVHPFVSKKRENTLVYNICCAG